MADNETSLIQELDLAVFDGLKELFAEAFADAVESHTVSGKNNVARIEAAISNGDANELQHAGHSLKGASGQFGAMVLNDLAKKMELFGKDGDIEKAKEILEDLKQARDRAEELMMIEIN